MSNFFKREDFDRFVGSDLIWKHANAILEERGTRVYTNIGNYEQANGNSTWTAGHGEPTWRALIVCIEEIPKYCAHEPVEFEMQHRAEGGAFNPRIGIEHREIYKYAYTVYQPKCKKCGIDLKLNWEPK